MSTSTKRYERPEDSVSESKERYMKEVTKALYWLAASHHISITVPVTRASSHTPAGVVEVGGVELTRVAYGVRNPAGSLFVIDPAATSSDRVKVLKKEDGSPEFVLAFTKGGRKREVEIGVPPRTLPDAINFVANTRALERIRDITEDAELAKAIDAVLAAWSTLRNVGTHTLVEGAFDIVTGRRAVPNKMVVELGGDVIKSISITTGYTTESVYPHPFLILASHSLVFELVLAPCDLERPARHVVELLRDSTVEDLVNALLAKKNGKREIKVLSEVSENILRLVAAGVILMSASEKVLE